MGRPAVDISGQRFGHLVVVGRADSISGPGLHAKWLVRCDCGTERTVEGSRLRKGGARSCGCQRVAFQREKVGTHRMSGTPTYEAWSQMRARCGNPKHRSFRRYGGRGITVCRRWQDSFEAFLEDMGHCPEGLSIERIDVNGNYEPSNCRWATMKEQGRNRRTNRLLTIDGLTAPMVVWAERSGVPYQVLQGRLRRGWSPRDAVFGREGK